MKKNSLFRSLKSFIKAISFNLTKNEVKIFQDLFLKEIKKRAATKNMEKNILSRSLKSFIEEVSFNLSKNEAKIFQDLFLKEIEKGAETKNLEYEIGLAMLKQAKKFQEKNNIDNELTIRVLNAIEVVENAYNLKIDNLAPDWQNAIETVKSSINFSLEKWCKDCPSFKDAEELKKCPCCANCVPLEKRVSHNILVLLSCLVISNDEYFITEAFNFFRKAAEWSDLIKFKNKLPVTVSKIASSYYVSYFLLCNLIKKNNANLQSNTTLQSSEIVRVIDDMETSLNFYLP